MGPQHRRSVFVLRTGGDQDGLLDGKTSAEGNQRCCERARTRLAAAHKRPGLGASTPGPRAREPAPAPPTRCPDPSHSHPTTYSATPLGQAAVGAGSPTLCRLARTSDAGHARDSGALASTGLAPVLALEIPLPRRPAASQP